MPREFNHLYYNKGLPEGSPKKLISKINLTPVTRDPHPTVGSVAPVASYPNTVSTGRFSPVATNKCVSIAAWLPFFINPHVARTWSGWPLIVGPLWPHIYKYLGVAAINSATHSQNQDKKEFFQTFHTNLVLSKKPYKKFVPPQSNNPRKCVLLYL